MAKAKKSATATNPPGDLAGAPPIDIGIDKGDRQKISESLSKVLADAFTLYLKTHNFHWNVTGQMFNSLHLMFEAQYNEQWLALDEIAERIRALGAAAPASYSAYQKLTSIEPGVEVVQDDWREMVRQLTVGNEAVSRTARKALEIADKAGDDPSVDMLTQRLKVHEKNAWMLRSLLQ
ncbi:DNA starvation/stationary phase protection protein [Lysobacter sp. KIS68-7]|uniref:Dps family protein n=1 Tax=Lysobacter sp. KIS68-7 TaxID=2904252 RepID=UPI001E453ADE|nr:Dps family protein [Lysobacter sp. KIS68-7]UHQ19820.1 DNA starvation/stationary phase protection protein [Lysobacter sp. KIS68-7]